MCDARGQFVPASFRLFTTVAQRTLFAFWRRRDLERAYLDALARELRLAPTLKADLEARAAAV